jgi:hypothetical protein
MYKKYFLSIITPILLFISTAYGNSKEFPQNKAIETKVATKIQEKFGDIIGCAVGSARAPIYEYNSLSKQSIKNLKVYINRQKGVITISFDYLDNTVINLPLFVYLYDANGQYINHFQTANSFYSQSLLSTSYPVATDGSQRLLKPSHNIFKYQINLRDAGFIHKAELGFVLPGQ